MSPFEVNMPLPVSKNVRFFIVKFLVWLVPLEILVSFSDHGNSDNNDQRRPSRQGVQGGYNFYGKKDGDNQKVTVGQSHELQKQGFW